LRLRAAVKDILDLEVDSVKRRMKDKTFRQRVLAKMCAKARKSLARRLKSTSASASRRCESTRRAGAAGDALRFYSDERLTGISHVRRSPKTSGRRSEEKNNLNQTSGQARRSVLRPYKEEKKKEGGVRPALLKPERKRIAGRLGGGPAKD